MEGHVPPPICIDVSAHEFVDWQRIANAGVKVGIAKIFQSLVGIDGQFLRNWEEMKNAGLIRGAFYFLNGPDLRIPTLDDARQNNINHHRTEFPVLPGSYPDPATWVINSFPTEATVRADADAVIDILTRAGGLEPGDLPLILDAEDEDNVSVQVQNAFGTAIHTAKMTAHEAPHGPAVGPPQPTPPPPPGSNLNRWSLMPGGAPAIARLISAWLDQVERNLPRLNGRRPMIYTGFFFWDGTAGNPQQTAAGVPYGQYPLWLYNGNPLGVIQANRQVPTPWRQNGPFLWQFAQDSASIDGAFQPNGVDPALIDASRMVTLNIPNPAAPNNFTLTELNDVTPLEALAGIEQRPAPVSLARHFPAALPVAPTNAFNVLIITQGFWRDEIPPVIQRFWDGVHGGGGPSNDGLTDIPPFEAFRAPNQPGLVVHFDAGPGEFLYLRQNLINATAADELVLPTDNADRIKKMLGALQMHVDSQPPADVASSTFWPSFPSAQGVTGSLVVVLRKPAQRAAGANVAPKPAELYKIDPSETCPVPVVAVNVIGDQWPRVAARAIAQIMGGLADEYELDTPAFATPPADIVPLFAPNLVYLSADERAQLGPPNNTPVLTVVPSLATQWNLPAAAAPVFLAHKGNAPNPDWSHDPVFNAPDTSQGHVKAMEGGAGYRGGVLRSDFDCLMRRIPSGVAGGMAPVPGNLPLQARVDLCTVCLDIVRRAAHLSLRPRIRLDSQRILYDTIKWANVNTHPIPFAQVLSMPGVNGATWSCSLNVTAAALTITDVKLDRRDDPFNAVSTIFSSIVFDPPTITLNNPGAGPPQAVTTLAFSDALGNRTRPPKLEIATDGESDHRFQTGIKLSLSWSIPTAGTQRVAVDAILSVVFKSQAADIDPEGAVLGARIYPQLALRYRELRTRDRVFALNGTIHAVAANAVPATQAGLDDSIKALANGNLIASAFCESNLAGSDSTFGAGAPMRAESGRKLAALRGVGTGKVPTRFLPPGWSWRYDYAHPVLAAGAPALAVVRASDDPAHPAQPATLAWPPASPTFKVTAQKEPRQGAYDAMVIHPDRGNDPNGHPIIAAPMCGELGVQLQLRHGLSAVHAPRVVGPFVGWGIGRGDQGARTLKGAPLIPPNQHVDVTVQRVNPGSVDLGYAATCRSPQTGEWQVILEQGLSVGFKYVLDQGIGIEDIAFVAKATGAADDATIAALRQAYADKAHPAVLDSKLRALYQALFPNFRFYDSTIDPDVPANVQQVPDVNGPPRALETS
jgi:hypothetical protein